MNKEELKEKIMVYKYAILGVEHILRSIDCIASIDREEIIELHRDLERMTGALELLKEEGIKIQKEERLERKRMRVLE